MDSGREYIERKYLHRQAAKQLRMTAGGSDAVMRFNRIRTLLLAFNIAAALALIAAAVILVS